MSCDWRSIDNINNIDEKTISSIHVDTRDFYFKTTNDATNIIGDSLCDFSDVISLIQYLYNKSGGECDWRCLCLDCDGMRNWELKYIRFYKYKDKWLVCDDNNNVINYELLQSSNVLERYPHCQ